MSAHRKLLIIRDLDGLRAVRKSWLQLEEKARYKSVFNSYAWIETWVEHYSKYIKSLLLFTYWDSDELCSVLPLYISVKSPSTAHYVSSFEPEHIETCSEMQDFLSLTEGSLMPTELFHELIVSEKIDTIKLSNVSPGSLFLKWASNLSGYQQQTKQRTRFYIELPNGIEKLERKTLRYRKVASKIGVKVRKVCETHELETVFNALVNLNSNHWLSKGKAAIFQENEFACFHKNVASKLLLNSSLSLYYLEYQGSIIAVNYSFVSGTSIIFYQSGNNTHFRPNISPGLLLHYAQASEAICQGSQIYDFMSSSISSGYKTQFANTHEDVVAFELCLNFSSLLKNNFVNTLRKLRSWGASGAKLSQS